MMRHLKPPSGPTPQASDSSGARIPERRAGQSDYADFEAVELYCPKCGRSVPVRKEPVRNSPNGEDFEYLCWYCSESLGTRHDTSGSAPEPEPLG